MRARCINKPQGHGQNKMKKITFMLIGLFLFMGTSFAQNQNQDQQRAVSQSETTCTTVHGSFLGNGGSAKTCVTTNSDGSKTTTVKSCKKTGASASVGVAKSGYERETCKTTVFTEPAKNSNNSSSKNKNGGSH